MEVPTPQRVLDLLLPSDEGSEVLTSAGLQEYINKLDVRREEVLLTLYANVAEQFSSEEAPQVAAHQALDGDAGFDLELSCSSALAGLGEQGLAEEEPTTAVLAGLAAQQAGVLGALREARQSAAGVRVQAELQQRLADFDAALAGGAYSEAAWIAVELQKAVEAAPGDAASEAASAARVTPLIQQLPSAVYAYCGVDERTHLPILLPSGSERGTDASAAALSEVWRALEVLGLLPETLRQLAANVVQSSVQPLLCHQQGAGALSDSPASSLASSNLSRATARGEARNSLERSLYKVLKALAEQILGGNEDYTRQLGAALWPDFAAAYIAAKLAPSRPQSDAEVEGFSRGASLGVKLEQKAVKLQLLPGEPEGPITRYVRQALNKFLNQRRNRFIGAARDVLASASATEAVVVGVPRHASAAGTPTASRALFGSDPQQGEAAVGAAGSSSSSLDGGLEGEDSPLASGEYAVSRAAEGVAVLMREALAEAIRSGNASLAQAMCGAVVDVAALMAALPPAHAGAGPEALLLPYPAALRHNDCHYVHQVLCNLPYQHAPRLQQLVHRSVNFVNPAVRLRLVGEEALHAMVRRQQEELLSVVDDFQQFVGLDGPAAMRCRKVVMQLLASFRRLGGVLRGVLAPDRFVAVSAALLQAVFGQVAADLLALHDISVEESEQIPKILGDLAAGARDAVLGGSNGSKQVQQQQLATIGGVPAERVAEALRAATPAVTKLQELLELLDIRMAEIRQRWLQGQLAAAGLSAGEVSHLVRALFEDTDVRRELLQVLEGGHA